MIDVVDVVGEGPSPQSSPTGQPVGHDRAGTGSTQDFEVLVVRERGTRVWSVRGS